VLQVMFTVKDGFVAWYVQACKHYIDEGRCVSHCPPLREYSAVTHTTRENPNGKYMYGRQCVKQCPREYLLQRPDATIYNKVLLYSQVFQITRFYISQLCVTPRWLWPRWYFVAPFNAKKTRMIELKKAIIV